MADEPTNPQQVIDDATKALGQTTPNTPPLMQTTPVELPPPKPESFVVPPKDQIKEPPPPVVKPPKKKGGKGMLIGMLLFFILTLPVAIYYGSQKYQQITEGRSRAGLTCVRRTDPPTANCRLSTWRIQDGICEPEICWKEASSVNTPTPRPGTATRTPTPGRGGNWAHCNTNADCLSNFCGATNQCVQLTERCPRCSQRMAPDGDPCACGNACNDTHCTGSTTGATSTPIKTPTSGGGGGPTATPGSGGGTSKCPPGTGRAGKNPLNECFGGAAGNPGGCGGFDCPSNQQRNVQCCYTNGCPSDAEAYICKGPGAKWEYKSDCVYDASCGSPAATNTPAPTNTTAPVATNTPVNTSAPGVCDASCDTDSNCESGLSCQTVTGIKRCRKSACPDRSNCECPIAEATTVPTERVVYVQQPAERVVYVRQPTGERVIAEAPIATETLRPTPKVPVSGGLFDVKTIGITIISILFLTLGLIL